MYDWLKRLILPWLRIDDGEPHPPAGHEPHEMMRVERANEGFLRLRLFQWSLYAIAWSFGITLASIALLLADWRLLALVMPLVLVAIVKAATLYVTMRLDYEMRWYVITDRSLLIREGVWNVQEITITFANAQNVRVTQGPLERVFGFSNVEVETAGGGGGHEGAVRHHAQLRGVGNPQEVRALILEMLRTQRSAGLGDPDDVDGAGVAQHTGAPSAVGATREPLMLPAASLNDVWAEARALRVALETITDHSASKSGRIP